MCGERCILVCTHHTARVKMKRKPPSERAVRVNISLAPKTLEEIDKNVDKLKNWLIGKMGVDEKEVEKVVSRSALITEVVQTLATPQGFENLRGGFAVALGVVDNGQQDLFGD